MRRRRGLPAVVAGALTIMVLAGCGSQPGSAESPSAAGSSAAVSGEITVLAAASLTESFSTIGKDFNKEYPSTTINFSFGSSATLATQVNQGAPADIFASADERTMKMVTDAGNAAAKPTIFATNTLQIAVPAGNPGKITGLADFADAEKRTALCDKKVPCGAAAQKVFKAAGVTAEPVSYEADVKAALQKVEADEVDAALVYKTDVTSAGDKVQGIDFDQADTVVNRYPITAVKQSQQAATADAFVDYVAGGDGRAVLQKAGFGAP